LLDLGEVNSISVTIIPILLGSGTPLFPSPYDPTLLTLSNHRVYKSGIISSTYEIATIHHEVCFPIILTK
jgi:dihydrofolate reductase